MHLYCDDTSLCKFGGLKSYLFLVLSRVPLILPLTLVSYIPYYVNFRYDNGPDMSSVLECFLGQYGCYTEQFLFCRSILCYVSGRRVKDFYEN